MCQNLGYLVPKQSCQHWTLVYDDRISYLAIYYGEQNDSLIYV
jgi:hypothetical protein